MTELRRQKLQGLVSTDNSTTALLGVGGVFTGDWVEVLDYGVVYVNVSTDKNSADNGLVVQHSTDGTNVDFTDEYTIVGGEAACAPIVPHARYIRVVYTNGTVAQTSFRMQTILKGVDSSTCIKYYDASNSSETALGISGVFTGEWVSTKGFGQAIVSVLTDEDSASQGLKIETSDDGVTTDHYHTFSVSANDPEGHHYPSTLESNYMRIVYTNGTTAQTTFKIKTTLFVYAVEEGHVHSIDFPIDDDHPAQIVRNVNVARKPDGSYVNIEATAGGNLKISLEEYDDSLVDAPLPVVNFDGIPIAEGAYTGRETVNKFGTAFNGVQVTATDIWDRADAAATQQIWLAPTQARLHDIVSTSASDDGDPVGTGARTIRIWGLTGWGTAEVSEDITMNGVGAVTTSNSYVIIHRMKVLTWGSAGPNVGIITATAAVDATVTAQINAGLGQTQMVIYGVPSTKTLYLNNFHVHLHDFNNPATSAAISFKLLVNELPDTVTTGFVTKHQGGVISFGNSNMHHRFGQAFPIPGPAIVKIQAIGTVADLFVSGGFDGILKTN
jgi:hypothetical protein